MARHTPPPARTCDRRGGRVAGHARTSAGPRSRRLRHERRAPDRRPAGPPAAGAGGGTRDVGRRPSRGRFCVRGGPRVRQFDAGSRGFLRDLGRDARGGTRLRRWLGGVAAATDPGRDGLGEPDGPDHRRPWPKRRLRRLRRAPARVRRPHGRARVLLQRLGWSDGSLPGVCRGAQEGEELPEEGYQGAYIEDLAREEGDPVPAMLARIEATLERFRIHFDSWAKQSELEQALPALLERLDTYQKDGALWVRSTAYGDEKDRVLIRSAERSGLPTYEAADIVYLRDKLERGFDRIIYVLGADHHGVEGWYCGRGEDARLRPVGGRGAPLPARPPHEGRRADEDVEAPWRRRLPRGVHGRGRSRRRPVVPRPLEPGAVDGDRSRPCPRAKREESGVLRPICACPDRRDPQERRGRNPCRRASGRTRLRRRGSS